MRSSSRSWSRLLRVIAGTATVVAVASAGALTLRAQPAGVPPTTVLGAVLAGVEQIVAILTEDVVPALHPAPGPVVLSTGTLSLRQGDLGWCAITNLGDELLAYRSRLTSTNGTVIANASGNVQPGNTGATGASDGSATFVRCEFDFEGLAADVRANLFVLAPDGSTVAALDAR